MRRFSLGLLGAMVVLIAVPPGASGATIGQTSTPNPAGCASVLDVLQPTVTSGNAYVVPADGIISSWRTQASANGGLLAMKVYRPLGGLTYQVVGHDGPHALTPSALNTFPANLAVRAGDVLGSAVPAAAGQPGCVFVVDGESFLARDGYLADGQSGTFVVETGFRLNISANLETTKCKGKAPTMAGTAGPDTLTGTPNADVIVGLEGKDTINGLAGNDVECGGTGKDTLKGGANRDTLFGQQGKDKLKGGGARDVCKGGKGNDSASKCEVEKSI